jgi:hypothetical protein
MRYKVKRDNELILYSGSQGEKYFLDRNQLLHRMILNGEKINPFVNSAIDQYVSDGIFLDIGAHHGHLSILCTLKKNSSRVIAVEPGYREIEMLIKNIRLNGVESRIALVSHALSDFTSLATIESGPNENPGMNKLNLERGDQLVTTCRGFDFLENKLIKEIELVKIDVEGQELEIIESINLKEYSQAIFVLEISRVFYSEIMLHRIYELFLEAGFIPNYGLEQNKHFQQYEEVFYDPQKNLPLKFNENA